jgi:hypothetical protein
VDHKGQRKTTHGLTAESPGRHHGSQYRRVAVRGSCFGEQLAETLLPGYGEARKHRRFETAEAKG